MTATREQKENRLEDDAPFFVVNKRIPIHTGPFAVYMDAVLCANLVETQSNWSGWQVLSNTLFKKYLDDQ